MRELPGEAKRANNTNPPRLGAAFGKSGTKPRVVYAITMYRYIIATTTIRETSGNPADTDNKIDCPREPEHCE